MQYHKQHEALEDKGPTLAPYHKRILSFIIDGIVIILIYILLEIIMQWMGFAVTKINVIGFTHVEFEAKNLGHTANLVIKCIFIIVPTTYFTLLTFFFNGQTLGKKIFKIRIVSLYHKKVGFWHCLERSLGYVASTLEFGLGFLQATWNHNRMALHDKIAETIVIKVPSKKTVKG